MPELFFSAHSARIDRERVHHWLSDLSYWARGRARAVQDAAMNGSRNYGVYDDIGTQVGYARVVTDGATFAWLCDVFVDPDHRGEGVGKLLVAGVVADLEPLHLERTVLATGDAHGLYTQFGFAVIEHPEMWMARAG
ncbi:GNAT family N-acetyltransferase [Microbacterium panaciterrae]